MWLRPLYFVYEFCKFRQILGCAKKNSKFSHRSLYFNSFLNTKFTSLNLVSGQSVTVFTYLVTCVSLHLKLFVSVLCAKLQQGAIDVQLVVVPIGSSTRGIRNGTQWLQVTLVVVQIGTTTRGIRNGTGLEFPL